jgi:hypothetical protein
MTTSLNLQLRVSDSPLAAVSRAAGNHVLTTERHPAKEAFTHCCRPAFKGREEVVAAILDGRSGPGEGRNRAAHGQQHGIPVEDAAAHRPAGEGVEGVVLEHAGKPPARCPRP